MKDTTNQQTPIMQNLLTLVRDYGHKKAVAWLQGEEELAVADDDLCSFLARQDIDYDRLPTADQDSIRDEYLEMIKLTFSQRLANAPQIGRDASLGADRRSDPSSMFSRMEAALRASAKELDHFHRTGQPTKSFMHSETLILCLGDLISELNHLPTADLSLVFPEPLGKPEGRSSSPCAGSGAAVPDVPPLGEVCEFSYGTRLRFKTELDILQEIETSGVDSIQFVSHSSRNFYLRDSQIPSLIAHLQAWLLTGSFSLTPPVSTQIDSGASLTSPARIPIELTHPTIHGDYYDWLKSLHGKEFENDFIKQHSRDFKEFNAIAMWAWSQSRETLAHKWKSAPPSPEKPVVQPTESDSAGLLEECKQAIGRLIGSMDDHAGRYPVHEFRNWGCVKSLRSLLAKLNA